MGLLDRIVANYVAPERAALEAPGKTADAWGQVMGQMDPNMKDPLQRWRQKIDLMVRSGDPTLQQQGLGMLQSMHTSSLGGGGGQLPNAVREYQYAQTEGFEGTFEDWKKANKAGMVMNMGDKYVTPQEAKSLRYIEGHPKAGQNVPPFTPVSEVAGQVEAFTPSMEKQQSQQQTSMTIVKDLEDMLFGENGIYTGGFGDAKNWEGKLGDVLESNVQYFMQNDPRFRNYSEYAQGVLAPLVKSLGEAGSLSASDIERANSLIPRLGLGARIDSPEVARKKLELLKRLIMKGEAKGGLTKEMVDEAMAESTKLESKGSDLPPPPPGVEWVD